MKPRAFCIAILGAESTGKSTLARDLAARLVQRTGQRVAWVDETLRAWCDAAGRTPRPDEQMAIARAHHARIDAAAGSHDWVVADTTAIMTAVYSQLLFGDPTLNDYAWDRQRHVDLTLLTALDLDWVPDGHQRDGPQVRDPVDRRVREMLLRARLPFSVIGGQGDLRLAQAWAALGPALRDLGEAPSSGGLFSGLLDKGGPPNRAGAHQGWSCACCEPDAERILRHPPSSPATGAP